MDTAVKESAPSRCFCTSPEIHERVDSDDKKRAAIAFYRVPAEKKAGTTDKPITAQSPILHRTANAEGLNRIVNIVNFFY
jgi:hypothetical protein